MSVIDVIHHTVDDSLYTRIIHATRVDRIAQQITPQTRPTMTFSRHDGVHWFRGHFQHIFHTLLKAFIGWIDAQFTQQQQIPMGTDIFRGIEIALFSPMTVWILFGKNRWYDAVRHDGMAG